MHIIEPPCGGNTYILEKNRTLDVYKRQVLALVDGRTPLIIELKHYDAADLLCPLVWELLRNYKGPYLSLIHI